MSQKDMFELSDDEGDGEAPPELHDSHRGDGDSQSQLLYAVWDQGQPSQSSSTQASGGLHFSTPAYTDHNISTAKFSQTDESNKNSQDFYQKQADKFTKGEAKELITKLDNYTEAAEKIVNKLIGGQFSDLKSEKDIENAQFVVTMIKGRLYNLAAEMRKRQFRRNMTEKLEATFLRKDEYEFLQKSNFSFLSTEEIDDTEDIHNEEFDAVVEDP